MKVAEEFSSKTGEVVSSIFASASRDASNGLDAKRSLSWERLFLMDILISSCWSPSISKTLCSSPNWDVVNPHWFATDYTFSCVSPERIPTRTIESFMNCRVSLKPSFS